MTPHLKKLQDELLADPEKAKAFLRKVLGPPKRRLEGQERTEMWLVLRFLQSTETSNNQHSWTEVYHQAGKTYNVHYGLEDDPIIEVVEDDEK